MMEVTRLSKLMRSNNLINGGGVDYGSHSLSTLMRRNNLVNGGGVDCESHSLPKLMGRNNLVDGGGVWIMEVTLYLR